MPRRLRIAIVGYGTGGQACALLLSADGHEVEVFERAPALGPVGAGFLLQPVGMWVLWEMGLLGAALAHGAPVTRLHGENVKGRKVMDMRYRELDERFFGLGLQRGALFDLLDTEWTEGRRIHRDCQVTRVDCDSGALTDAHGTRFERFDVVIVADGAASRLRSQVVPSTLDRPYPWGAQWCLVEQGDWPWFNELRQRYVGARRMAGMLPVGTRPADPVPKLSFFWSLPVSALDGDESQRQWRHELETLWPEAAARIKTIDVPHGLAAARYRDAVHKQWSRGRAVLLGDAAHAMSPQLGQGVNMALLDAQALRDALRSHAFVPHAFADYQHRRRSHVAAYHFWSRWLTPLFQSEHDRAAALRDLAFHPLSRLPIGRTQMLQVLSGTRSGWLGNFRLPAVFLDSLPDVSLRPVTRIAAPLADARHSR